MAPLGAIMAAAAGVNLAARGFSYHDNGVRFLGVAVYSGTTFNVTDLSISSGQDPQALNHVGDVHKTQIIAPNSDSNGESEPPEPGFVFTAGRHKTTDVANWWNARIPPSQNTFGHTAGQLNFGFIGDLVLEMRGTSTVYLPDIGLAQGSDDNGSNWWFGGKHCTHTGSNTVSCHGKGFSGFAIDVVFIRGGGGQINDVFIDSYSYPGSS